MLVCATNGGVASIRFPLRCPLYAALVNSLRLRSIRREWFLFAIVELRCYLTHLICFKLLLICCLMIGNENYTKHFYFVLQKLSRLTHVTLFNS